jgi:hypothetical protein
VIKTHIDTTYTLAILTKCIVGGSHNIDQKTTDKVIGHELGTVGTAASLSVRISICRKKNQKQDQAQKRFADSRGISTGSDHLLLVWKNQIKQCFISIWRGLQVEF